MIEMIFSSKKETGGLHVFYKNIRLQRPKS